MNQGLVPTASAASLTENVTADLSSLSGIVSLAQPDGETKKIHWSVEDFRVRIPELSTLAESERAQVFNRILATARRRSEHPHGFRSAALVITESGQLFLASNTQRQHEYHKDCAEVNLVNSITQLMGTKEKIRALYLMAGFSSPGRDTPTAPLELPFAPCGKCVDTLCACSLPQAHITMLPPNDGTMTVKINDSANHIDEVQPGEAWKAPLTALMIHSVISLSPEAQRLSQEGWRALVGGEIYAAIPSEADARHKISRTLRSKGKLSDDEQQIKRLIEQAARNAYMGRKSEAALDVDSSLENINRFMVQRIAESYRRRTGMAQGEHQVDTIRCVLMRLADGSFHAATEVEGPEENAVPHAEVTAVAATRDLHQSITDVWVMRLNKADIAQGIMRTSPKEGLERIYKRRPRATVIDWEGKELTDSVTIRYIPFNAGTLENEQVNSIASRYAIENIYASRYKGSRFYMHAENSERSAAKEHGSGPAR